MSLFKFSFMEDWGSKSSDIHGITSAPNPLPSCPKSPNCIRTTKQINHPIDSVFYIAAKILDNMGPIEKSVSKKDYKIVSVFRVAFFKDDMVIQLSERNITSTYLHIRSASRMGKSDLGVNTRRVKRFLKHFYNQI